MSERSRIIQNTKVLQFYFFISLDFTSFFSSLLSSYLHFIVIVSDEPESCVKHSSNLIEEKIPIMYTSPLYTHSDIISFHDYSICHQNVLCPLFLLFIGQEEARLLDKDTRAVEKVLL